jgi:hypothetical protein
MESNPAQMSKLDMHTMSAIDLFLEEYYEQGHTKRAGEAMANSQMKKSQVHGLENLLVSTSRFSEIINYIKNQVGKDRKEWQSVGPILLDQLASIETKAHEIAGEDPAKRLAIKLILARGWARQVVAHYLYGSR